MPDRCVGYRPSGDNPIVWNDDTGEYDAVTATLIFPGNGDLRGGPCRFGPDPGMPRGQMVEAGERSSAKRRWLCSIPIPCPQFIERDLIVAVSSSDPEMLTGPYVVVEVDSSSTTTARRLMLERPTGESPRDH